VVIAIEQSPAAGVAGGATNNYRVVAVESPPWVQLGKAWAGRSAEEVVVKVSCDLEGGRHLALELREVVDRSLVEVHAFREEQLARWGRQAKQPDEHQQVEACLPEDWRQENPREGVAADAVYRWNAAVDNVAGVGVSQGVVARHL
jgi:hypothetical protein